MKRFFNWLVFFGCIAIAGCTKLNIYEQRSSFPNQQWAGNNKLHFTYEVKDSSTNYYNFYLVVRHTEKYNYNNIWVNFTLLPQNDTAHSVRLNLLLADNNGWLGTAMDDVIEERSLINKDPIRLTAGTYNLFVQQVMREDPLQNILQVGVRVEKIVQ